MDHMISFKEIEIPIADVTLKGRLREIKDTKALIVFSHGSGSSRLSSRNNYVADLLQGAGFSSLLFDLLTEKEDLVYMNRFNIDLLSERLVNVTNWLDENEKFNDLHIGYFGASTGAASALKAAAQLKDKIYAVVSRGGRPDLALAVLDKVTCPTLLIIGSKDQDVIELNKKAYVKLGGIKKIEIIEGATHLFSEPGKLEEVAKYTIHWFNEYLK